MRRPDDSLWLQHVASGLRQVCAWPYRKRESGATSDALEAGSRCAQGDVLLRDGHRVLMLLALAVVHERQEVVQLHVLARVELLLLAGAPEPQQHDAGIDDRHHNREPTTCAIHPKLSA